ncbi:MAG: site-specific integrase [Candidatus Omnitrophica bacterium]|nr:site-specific integrase [Candidatus Omnitrophota bacterium]
MERTKAKLTQSFVNRCEPEDKEYTIWDADVRGFGLRVRPSGVKTYILMYTFHGRLRKKTIGSADRILADDARETAMELFLKIAKDIDPASQISVRKSMKDLCDDYMRLWAKPRKRSWVDDRYRINKRILPRFSERIVESITTRDVEILFQEITKKAPTEANRVVALLKKMFNLAIRWNYVPEGWANPCKFIDLNKENKRTRWVTPEEMNQFLKSVMQEELQYRAALLLYILTGLRNKELMAKKWKDLIIQPAENGGAEKGILYLGDTKNGQPIYLPLSSAALAVFREIPQINDSPWIFPNLADPSSHWLEYPRKSWYRVRQRAGMPDLRIHDLRRTFGAWLANSGASIKMIGGLLHQSSQSITDSVYTHLADDPMRQAANQHGEKIVSILRMPTGTGD